jgi:hypothetical protein
MTWNQAQNDQRFQALSTEWGKISTLARWESRIEEVRAEDRRLREKGLWLGGPRDFLGVIGRSRHELTHSALLAWLLDPAMRHSLKAEFLRRLLGRLFPGDRFENLEQARSQTEVTRGPGRADIVVWGSDFTLVIENKVDATEGGDQCDYYYRAFSSETRPLFVFLTPDGRDPSSATGVAREAYKPLGYGDIAAELHATLDSVQAVPGAEARSVAEGYLQALRHEFEPVK